MPLTFGAENFEISNDPASIQKAYTYIREYKTWGMSSHAIKKEIFRFIGACLLHNLLDIIRGNI